MTNWLKHRAGDADLPRQMTSAKLLREFLAAAPGVIILMDEQGKLVFRSKGALLGLDRMRSEHGDRAVQSMRERISAMARRPEDWVEEQIVIPSAQGDVVYLFQMARLTHGCAFTYTDLSVQQRAADAVVQLAAKLRESGRTLAGLGNDLAGGAEQASTQTGLVAGGASEMSSTITEIASFATEAADQARAVAESTRQATDTMERLRGASEEIGNIVRMISMIADQTKLLALNATIEAARAGHSGRGFGVVADEVKGLAGRTADATSQVTGMISAVQDEANGATAAIQQIDRLIDAVVDRQTTIAAAMEEQSVTAAEVSAAIEAVARTLEQTSTHAETIRSAATAVDTHAHQLNDIVSH
jgi:methyl-accepting chemotaxis protein